ncbi:S-adenosylmethionine-dependent methyltransferase [Saccharomycopsis crataegensis]|uniref:S-adenosylmethionine-dependent methyltransferase n=1 Tax=Saccharomycopsis crataegensis TaxID=43959 RepID=A0AAV5QGK7_9ASCO|nr:S-adenosylmethionine-dependent methyltransferase [Saccharomycopsis crataegensis]
MEDFDPLDLFSPDERPSVENVQIEEHANCSLKESETPEDSQVSNDSDDEQEEQEVVHILDLPHISLKPSFSNLLFILKLFQPEVQYNFSSKPAGFTTVNHDSINDKEFFNSKGISEEDVVESIAWFTNLSLTKLIKPSNLKTIPYLRFSSPLEFFNYITSIVSSDLSWIQGATLKETNKLRDEIWKAAGLRLAENCGRTAQPEFVRSIVFDCVANSKFNVKLKEPSLTEDNLGLKTWGSSLILAERLIKNYYNDEEKKNYLRHPILELGAGTGLVGMACGIIEKENIISMENENTLTKNMNKIFLTDLPAIIPNLQDNVNLNNLSSICEVQALDWQDPSSFDEELGIFGATNLFKTIILSDPVYSSSHPYLIVNMIKRYLDFENHGTVLLELPEREKFEEVRELLWGLIKDDEKLSCLKLVDEDIENGFDDFGKQRLIFKHWIS